MKYLTLLSIVLALFVFFVAPVSASLAVIEPDGNVIVNVLGTETSTLEIPQSESLTVTKTLSYAPEMHSQVSLRREDGEVYLKVLSDSGEQTLDVGEYDDEILEIEERPKLEKMTIAVSDGKFVIKQNELTAHTDYEITVDSENGRLLLDAPGGKQFLSISPREAVQTLFRAKTVSNLDYTSGISIIEDNNHVLTYRVQGEKLLNFFDFYYHPVEVTAYISALTGEITRVDQPQWLQFIGFLFS